MYGDHIAGVEKGRCSGEDGCGLNHDEYNSSQSDSVQSDHDGSQHGTVVSIDSTTTWHKEADFTAEEMVDMEDHDREYLIAPPTTDYEEDGTFYAIGPDEIDGDEPKYPINSCSDVQDAWHLRGHGDYGIEQSTLENRIQERARELDCSVPGTDETNDESPESTEDCGCNTGNTMSDNPDNDFDLPDLSVDALAEKNDAVSELKAKRDSLEEAVDEMEQTITEAFDEAEHFSVELDEDECPCEAVDDLVSDLDEKVAEIEDLRDELDEYRAEEVEDRLDTLEDLGADRDEWEDESLDALDEEIERREEVLEAADADMSVKDINESTDEDDTDPDTKTMSGTRTFGRGHGA